jgi:hypothetical protein
MKKEKDGDIGIQCRRRDPSCEATGGTLPPQQEHRVVATLQPLHESQVQDFLLTWRKLSRERLLFEETSPGSVWFEAYVV